MESQYLKFTLFTPSSLETRFGYVRLDRVDAWYTMKKGDFLITCIEVGNSTYESMDSFEDVTSEILRKELKGQV